MRWPAISHPLKFGGSSVQSRPAAPHRQLSCAKTNLLCICCNVVPAVAHLICHLSCFHGGKIYAPTHRHSVSTIQLFAGHRRLGQGRPAHQYGSLLPPLEGKIITDNDRNGNTGVDIQVKHMATPQSLTPAKQTYLVWVQPRGKDPELLGALRVNENLEGSLKAATTYKTFDVLITAEDNMKPETPSSMVILKGSVERK